MSGARLAAVVGTQVRDLVRRRLALVLLTAIPLAYYGVLAAGGGHNAGYAIVPGTLGMAWPVAGGPMFAVLAAYRVDPLLVLAGYRPSELVLGRLVTGIAVGCLIGAVAFTVMAGISRPPHPGMLAVAMALIVVGGVPLGLAIAALLPRDLEATLVLILVDGMEMAVPKLSTIAPAFPFFASGHFLAAAGGTGLPTDVSLLGPTLVSLGWAAGLLALALQVWWRRVGVAPWARPAPTVMRRGSDPDPQVGAAEGGS